MGIQSKHSSAMSLGLTPVSIDDMPKLVTTLKERLPKSCNVYNMAINFPKFSNETSFYLLNNELSPNSWIVATYLREDCGMDINVSAPSNLSAVYEFKGALKNAHFIQWNKPFIFAAIDQHILFLVEEVLLEVTGKVAKVFQNIMYYGKPDNFLNINTDSDFIGVGVSISNDHRGVDFLHTTWKFATEGSYPYIEKLVSRNGSAVVVIDEKVVSGLTLNGSGLMTMLNTLPNYRKKGYAELSMKYFIKMLFIQDLIPCCTVEVDNHASITLQKKVGLDYSHEAYYVPNPN